MMHKKVLLSIFCSWLLINTYAQTAKADTLSPHSKTAYGKRNRIMVRVTVDTAFSGGEIRWRDYLLNNINAATTLTNKAPAGIYSVVVQFITDKAGFISEVRTLTNNGYGMEEEVFRAIRKKSPWTPAAENVKTVKAYGKVKVVFEVIKIKKKKRKHKGLNLSELSTVVKTASQDSHYPRTRHQPE